MGLTRDLLVDVLLGATALEIAAVLLVGFLLATRPPPTSPRRPAKTTPIGDPDA